MVEDAEGELMPTINVIFNDFELLVGKKLPRDSEELTDLLAYVKGEVESLEGEELSIEIKDGNRPDLWGIEGIARAMRGALGVEKGLKRYLAKTSSAVDVVVDPRIRKIRPYIACAVVKGVHLTDEAIRGFMHLQDKLDQTYGRKRARASIGLYNFRLIKPPLSYTVAKPREVSFVPLEGGGKLSLREIVESHPKGLEYGHIVKGFKEWPILLDAEGKVLSFPPIINSNDLGKITEENRDILIEVTGTDNQTVLNTLTLVALSVSDRGGRMFTTRVKYPYAGMREEVVPSLATSEVKLELKLVKTVLGLELSRREVIELLKRARYDAYPLDDESVLVKVPCYRVDIMHPIDIVEDVAIMYGFNNIKPRWPQMVTFGEMSSSAHFSDSVREVMVGLGFQEILTFSMSNPQNLFSKMNLEPQRIVEVINPMIERFTCLRSWLMPSLMEFLSNNTHVSYPQRIFEVAECAVFDESSRTGVRDLKKLACLSIHSKASFSEIKSVLDAFFINFGLRCYLDEAEHGSFIEGRVGRISVDCKEVGFIGEVSPAVLEAWGLENPVVGFEVDLSKLFGLRG